MNTNFKIFSYKIIFVNILAGMLLLSCDTKSSIQFAGGRNIPASGALNLNPGIEPTTGGHFEKVTSGGYKTSLSLGTKTSAVEGVTASGYKVRMNIQGEMAP